MARFSNGWVKVYRSVADGSYDAIDIGLLVWLISNANYVDGKSKIPGKIGRINLMRGQLATSIKEIGTSLSLSDQSVRTRLKSFENQQTITRESTHRGTIITILNYDKYQCIENEHQQATNNELTTKQQTANKQLTNDQQTANNILNKERIKELKKVKIKNKELNPISAATGSAPNAKNLIAFYCEKYKQRFGVNPVITGKESGAVRNILKSMSYENAQEIITDYFDLSDAWIVQRMYALSILQDASVINRIQAKRQGVDVTRQRSLEYEKQTEYSKITEKFLKEYENAKISKNT